MEKYFLFVDIKSVFFFSRYSRRKREIIKACLWEPERDGIDSATRFSRNNFAVSSVAVFEILMRLFFLLLCVYREVCRKRSYYVFLYIILPWKLIVHWFSIEYLYILVEKKYIKSKNEGIVIRNIKMVNGIKILR